jgi:hypothetical protein
VARIKSIHLTVKTANTENAGTDGDVYLGFCGREFFLDTSANDFEKGSSRTYVLGEGTNVKNPTENDPRVQNLNEEDVQNFPVYLRLSPTGGSPAWKLERAVVTVNNQLFPMWETNGLVFTDKGIWLGRTSGLVIHIPMHDDKG